MTGQAVAERVSVNQIEMSATAGGGALAPQSLGDVVRFAEVMAKADIAIPPHLRGNPGACLAVAMQAMRWEMDPFAVASKTYLVNKTIAYEAQLISAVINTRAGLRRRLAITFDGAGDARRCIVTGEFTDGAVQVYESPAFGKITPKNSPLWKSDPDQQQAYFSVRSFGRRFCPEVILGVYDRDELATDIRNVTPEPTVSPALARLAAIRGAQATDAGAAIVAHTEREIAATQGATAHEDDFNNDITDIEPAGTAGYNDGEPEAGGEADGNGAEGSRLAPEQLDVLERLSAALFRATSKAGLKSYAGHFWGENGGAPEKGSPMHDAAGRIWRQHEVRVTGAVDAEGCRAAVDQIIGEVA